jgi:uncharacterized protein YndB with AHSA1/START domain
MSFLYSLVLGAALLSSPPAAEERAVAKSVTVAAPASAVWRAWTTSEGVKEFLGIDSNIQLKFGGRYELLFSNDPPIGAQGSEGCQVLSYLPEKMLSFSWNAPPTQPTMRNQRTFVVVTLTPEGSGTKVELRHAGWGVGPDWDKAFAYFDNAWGFVLGALKTRFDSGPTKDVNAPAKVQPKPDLAALDKMGSMIGGTEARGEARSSLRTDH